MSTRSFDGLGRPAADSAFDYLNRGLQITGLFFFINGIYVAFFSANIVTTVGYYLVVLALLMLTLSRAVSPEKAFVPDEVREVLGTETDPERARSHGNSRSSRGTRQKRARSNRGTRRNGTGGQRGGFDVRRYYRAALEKLDGVASSGRTSRRSGRDRL
ncbi:hypothetical protein DMJ13_07195 [halophilic archaeon]|nr:hypothetical protein DMJ13_07195 [halophilic archaeon]